MDVTHRYQVYGLRVRSELSLPELRPDAEVGDTDVHIRMGTVPAATPNANHTILRVDGTASFLVRDGREIIVEASAQSLERNVRLYLLGSAMGILLHQKGLLPLHANAIEIDGRAVAFMGESGAGKSTLAAWLHDEGHRLIADDVCVLRSNEEGVWVHPGLPRIRLWKDALERTGRRPADFDFSYAGDERYEKFDVPISPERSAEADLELAAIYLLASGETFAINPLIGVDAVDAVFAHTYRGFAVSQLGRSQLHFNSAVKVVRSRPIFSLHRRREPRDMQRDVPKIIEHAKEVIKASQTCRRAISPPRE